MSTAGLVVVLGEPEECLGNSSYMTDPNQSALAWLSA